jgi:hypothetical protein
MPYRKILKGKNRGKYVSKKSGKIRTLKQIQAMHVSKKKKNS